MNDEEDDFRTLALARFKNHNRTTHSSHSLPIVLMSVALISSRTEYAGILTGRVTLIMEYVDSRLSNSSIVCGHYWVFQSWPAGQHSPKHRDIFKFNLAICLKKQVYNFYVLPAMALCCRYLDTDQTSTEQTCGRTDQNGKKYAQHHITYKDRKTNIWVKEKTKVIDIISNVRK